MKNSLSFLIFTFFVFSQLLAQDFTRTNIEGFISTIKAGDFDGDGDMDFIASPPGFQPLRLFINNGESSPMFNFNEIITDILIGPAFVTKDLDGDGDLDIVGNAQGDIVIAFNDGSANFNATLYRDNTGAQLMDVADMNGDGVIDIVGLLFQSLYVHFRDGEELTEVLIEDDLQSLATFDVMDIDNDGDQDIVGGRTTVFDEHILLYRNDGSGSFTKETITSNGGSLVNAISHSDFNGDGLPDIIYGSDRDLVILMSSASSYEKMVIGSGEFFKVEVADLDGDLNMDIVASSSGVFNWYRQDDSGGALSFEEREIANFNTASDDFFIADLNNDGDLDILSINNFMHLFDNVIPQAPSSNKNTLLADAYSLGPNPSHDEIILLSLTSSKLTYQMYNMQGQLVLSGQEGVIDIGGLNNGAYVLNIKDKESGKVAMEKVVKQ